MSELPTAHHWVNGLWSARGTLGESRDPANGEVIGHFHDGDAAVMEAAIAAANKCFERHEWSANAMLRAAALSHLADAFQQRGEEVVDTLTRENGKLRGEAHFELALTLQALRFASSLALQNYGRILDPAPNRLAMVIRQPVGVAGLIVPWNGPVFLAVRALSPALASGCTAVLKLPARAAQTAYLLAQIIQGVAEIPPGAVNVVIESGSAGAELLVTSPDVPVVSFTGSSATGVRIAEAAAAGLKRVGLELGGKAPHVVFDDADIEAALPVLEKSATVFGGQFCMTGSRVIVQRGVAASLRQRLAERFEHVVVGPASDARSDMGPLIDHDEVRRVDAAVRSAIEAGARPIVRGGVPDDVSLRSGAFYRPVLLEVDADMPVETREEFFGPVQTLQTFEDEDEAVAMANDTVYGLSSSLWTRDVDRAQRVARRLQAGYVAINSWADINVGMEEGGWKRSGLGRLSGLTGIDDFFEYKQISQTWEAP